jgi:hypothetical protein
MKSRRFSTGRLGEAPNLDTSCTGNTSGTSWVALGEESSVESKVSVPLTGLSRD